MANNFGVNLFYVEGKTIKIIAMFKQKSATLVYQLTI
jgi:hypothetical protein